ncbi:MAG: hypothetical protein KGO92_03650 [Bacteroidota bacterium]|nr:hypothetical protein [Bacteroidota bacterium]
MKPIHFPELIQDMLTAARDSLTSHWKEAAPYAEKEMNAFAENIRLIAKLKLEGKISLEQAKLHVEIQKNAMRIVLLTIEGLGILAVEAAINAAIDAVRTTVNKAIGWTLL